MDLVPARGMKKTDISFVYVPLSRVHSLKDVTILRPFDSSVLMKSSNKDYEKMDDFKKKDICHNI